ncbi:MAG TPA: hypothetical protein QGH10_03585 [Armatimonadota bacterium]|nr:hypothetical protein [Armatimonadota bacterium]
MTACYLVPLMVLVTRAGAESHIKRSDVVFPYTASADTYRHYGATVVAWGFHPFNVTGEERARQWRQMADAARGVGARYQARVELDAGWKGMIDYDPDFIESACRSLAGEALTYRSWEGLEYKGHLPYQFCTNSPSLRAYLKLQVQEAMAVEPDMLHIDAIAASHMTQWRGGCFCRWCVDGFRAFLHTPEHADALRQAGIDDLEAFDYGALLRGRGLTVDDYRAQLTRWPPTLPLAQEYLTFHHLSARKMLDELRVEAERLAGRPIPISTSTQLREARDWWSYPVADHFTIEASFQAAERKVPTLPIFRYRLADALDRRIMSTGVPQWDLTLVRDENRPGLVRTWIAQAYAFGHHFMAPHSMWCGAGEKTRYESKPGDCDDLYRFVSAYRELFDGYEPVAHVGVLYSNGAFRRWRREVREAGVTLTQENVPWRFVVAGDEWMPRKLAAADLEGLQALVVADPTFLDPEQQAVVDAFGDGVVNWADRERLEALVPREISVRGADGVMVLPRANPPGAPVLHLLNTTYLPDSDSMRAKRSFTLAVADRLFDAETSRATLIAPGSEPTELTARRVDGGAEIDIPVLDLWAVLRLGPSEGTPGGSR